MTERFLIDVIVPVYNGASYLPAFWEMFSRQADERVRLLFVDDGSGDGSGALLDGFAASGRAPVRVIHQENAGVSAARNAGLAASDAAFVTFFDVDDAAAPEYTAVLLAAAERREDVFLFPQRRVTEEDFIPVITPGEPGFSVCTPEEQLREFLADPTRLGVYDVMLSRDFLLRNGLRFAEGYRYYEDYDFLYRAFARAERILRTDRALYYYVLRKGSAMGRFDAARLSCLTLLEDLEGWFGDKVPAFEDMYERWGVARIYWSVLWQAALAAPSFNDFRRFAEKTRAAVYLRKLRGFPSRKVTGSSRLFLGSKLAYYGAVKLLGGRRTHVRALDRASYEAVYRDCPDPRKILIYGMTDNPGGIESYLMGLLRRQAPGTFDFLCDFPSVAYADEIAARGSRVHFIPAKSRDLSGHWRGTAKVLRDHPEYATLYCNVLDAGCVFTAGVARLFGRRIVVHSHNGDTDKRRLHRMCRPVLNLITRGRVTCSEEASRHMFGRTGEDILFIPNAIDGKKYAFDPAVRAAKRGELALGDKLTLCHVGRISRQKNPLFLLDILAAVREKRPDALLMSVGEGEMGEEFDAAIRRNGLTDAVLRLGRRPDVPALLQAADVFLLPSLYEGLSIALLEAQAAGLPSVVSDVISPQTVITDTVRTLALSESPETWAETVLAAGSERKNTLEQLAAAGFDISCCGESDGRLMELLRR